MKKEKMRVASKGLLWSCGCVVVNGHQKKLEHFIGLQTGVSMELGFC